MKKLLLLLALLFTSGMITLRCIGQSLAVNTDGSPANTAAILDVKSFTKGVLIPRTKTSSVTTTVKGLIIYDTTTNSFWFHNGTAWTEIASTGASSGWATTGNTGTTYGTNFIGTTDNKSLLIKVLGQVAGRVENSSANNNTSLGFRSLNSITTGADNVAIGSGALEKNTVGKGLVAIGDSAAYNTDISAVTVPNVAIGYKAMINNISGWNSVAIGYQALYNNTSAWSNVAVGPTALYNNNGYNNAAFGFNTLSSNLTGSYNAASGSSSLSNSTGDQNSGFGGYALVTLSSGSNNTGLGYSADVSTGTMNNATVIGANAVVNASNKVRIGNSSVTVVEGQVGYSFPSDARFKENVQEDVKGLSFILKLRPVSYNFNRSKYAAFIHEKTGGRENELAQLSSIRTTGFIAQDLEKTIKETGFSSFSAVHAPANETDNYSVSYDQFVVPLVKSVQELNKKIEDLELTLAALKKQLEQNKK